MRDFKMQDTEKHNIAHLEVEINFHYSKAKEAKAYLETLPEDFQEYEKVVHKTHKIMTSHFDSLNKAKEFILNTKELNQIVLDEINKLRETEKPHNVFYCLYTESFNNENESCFIFWLLSVFEYFIFTIEQKALSRKIANSASNKENPLLSKLNIDFLIPDFILLLILRACRKPNIKTLKEVIDVWYEREVNTLEQKAMKELERLKNSSGLKVPGKATIESLSKINIEELNKQQLSLNKLALEYPELLQNESLLNKCINSYTENFTNNKLKFEHFTYAKHLFVFDEYLKIKEREGVSIGYLTLNPYTFKEVIEDVFNPTCLVKESEKIEDEMHKYQFIVFLLMLGRLGVIEFIDLYINCPKDDNSSNDYWAFKISINPDFRKIREIGPLEKTQQTGNNAFVLYYDDENKKIKIDGKLYNLIEKEVIYNTIKIFIESPNTRLPIEKFMSIEDTQNPDTIRQRVKRVKTIIPEIKKYIPQSSKHENGYILILNRQQIAKFK